MVCRRYNDALNEVAAGGAAPAALDFHLRGCADCRSRLALLRRALAIADEQLQELTAVEPSAAFLRRLHAAVAEPATTPAWRAGWLWPSLATATVLVVAFTVVLAYRTPDHNAMEAATRHTPPEVVLVRQPGPAPAQVVAATSNVPRPRRVAPRHEPAGPPVLVPAGEFHAVVELIALVNRERLAPAALVASGESIAPLAAPSPIHIQPIEIVPLDLVPNPGT